MAASAYIEKKYGRKTRSIENPITRTVGTSPALVLQNNPDRLMWLIVNLSSYNVYIAFEPDVSTTKGVLLSANGGSCSMSVDEDGEAVTHEVWAIAGAANCPIYVLEMEAM